MKKGKGDGIMEWYVLNYDWNAEKICSFNIFNNRGFSQYVDKLLDTFITMDKFVEDLKHELQYYFWSKREYEISVGDAFDTNFDNYEKIDVYQQVLPNIKALAKYIIDKHNEQI